VLVASENRYRAAGEKAFDCRDSGEANDAGPNHENRVTVMWCRTKQAVRGNRDGLVQAGAAVGDRIGQRVQHGRVSKHLFAPPTAKVFGESEGAT
jgi:hypothetical protein